MRVLIYAPLSVLGHHFETDLEIAEDHLIKGNEVFMIRCNSDLKPLRFTACLGCFRCEFCQSRNQEGIRLLSKSGKLHLLDLGPLNSVSWTNDQNLSDLEILKGLKYKGSDLGSAYASSLISELRDPRPDLSTRINATQKALHLMAGLHDRFDEILEETKPDIVYFFNGRFCLFRPLLRICQIKNIKFYVHERGNSNEFYSLTENEMPHDLNTVHKMIDVSWNDSSVSIEKKADIASEWYEKRAKGLGVGWSSFTINQDLSELPENWNTKKRNISIFISSEDEMESVPGWGLTFFPNQSRGIDFICQNFLHNTDFHFYVRIHPNLRGLKNQSVKELNALDNKFNNCTVVKADSTVSTYSLLKFSEKIITFGSTMGVEATYWGKPSLLLGKAFYQFFNTVYLPKNKEDIIHFIRESDLVPAAKAGALIYGYWAATFGIPFKHYQSKSLTTGLFKNHSITGNRAYMFMSYFFVFFRDFLKILKGEYGFWHLKEKIKSKLRFAS